MKTNLNKLKQAITEFFKPTVVYENFDSIDKEDIINKLKFLSMLDNVLTLAFAGFGFIFVTSESLLYGILTLAMLEVIVLVNYTKIYHVNKLRMKELEEKIQEANKVDLSRESEK